MRKIKYIWIRFRAWRLNRWADSMLRKAEYHKHSAKTHTAAASLYWIKASDVRSLARRLQAARL